MPSSPTFDLELTLKYIKVPRARCHKCGSKVSMHEAHFTMAMWKDTHIYCGACDTYLCTWDYNDNERIYA